MAFFRALPCAQPLCPIPIADVHHIPYAIFQIRPLFNDGAPGRPNRRMRLSGQGKRIVERQHILGMKRSIAVPLHLVRIGGALSVDIEHEETVVAGRAGVGRMLLLG